MKSSGQVHCVRRLGLPESEWKSVEVTPEGRTIRSDRHITSVKMSADQADEVGLYLLRNDNMLMSSGNMCFRWSFYSSLLYT